MQTKPFAAGSGIEFKELGDKILITGQSRTRLKEGNFLLEAEHIEIRAGHGIKISSIHPNILIIAADTIKQDEKIYDLQQGLDKRLEVIEKIFSRIIKDAKK